MKPWWFKVLVFLAVFGFGHLSGQADPIDSLETLLAQGPHLPGRQAELNYYLGRELLDSHAYDESIRVLERSLGYYQNSGDSTRLMWLYRNIGANFFFLEYWVEAAFWFEGALRMAEYLEDDWAQATFLGALGNIYVEMEEYEAGREFLFKAKAFELEDSVLLNQLATNLGVYYQRLDSLETCIRLYREALKIGHQPSLEREAMDYINLGEGLVDFGRYEEGHFYLLKGDSILSHSPKSNYLAISKIELGYYWMKVEEWDSAQIYMKEGMTLASERNLFNDLADGYEYMKEMMISLGDWKAASAWSDSVIVAQEKQKAGTFKTSLEKIDILYDIRKSQEENLQEVKLLKQESYISNLRLVILLGFILLLALLVGFLVFRSRTNKRFAQKELERSRLQREQLREKLEFKNKELTQFATYIVTKNQFLKSLHEKAGGAQGNPREKLIEVKALIQKNLSFDQDAKEFELRVREANEAFFFKLESKFPDLSEKERRLASLVYLNVSSKDIADILHISVSGVEKGRHRLRKKLGLAQGESLTSFLKSL